ncbi:LysR family transcriptional regulator [Comamonas serinivorans]|uniref:LysR family transcriptional regulator n=1 Tax=Comamonas serinivorans TaxID=1082851 RepID=A0A1Y0ETX7_9BURK|nr:LysR family transcriptional regulator [Comamonas serinivorans]ARU06819.1 LysR family transcriptional regulator [Comamonas serinivorans]
MDWNDLRVFLAVARSGTLQTAARQLAVDHTTVSRRIKALEASLGATLFVRAQGGHELTAAGLDLLPRAEAMEKAAHAALQSANRNAAPPERGELAGVVRVGATEGFGAAILAGALARLGQAHPRLTLDLLAVPRALHLSKREADVVISLERPLRGPYVVTKLCDYTLHLYASRRYLAQHGPIATRDDLAGHAYIGYVDDLLYSNELHFLDELYRPESFALRSTSVTAQLQAALAGCGIAILPGFLAREHGELVRILPELANFQRRFWMSMPTENKAVPRVTAVWQYLKREVALRMPEPQAR